eukprot:57169-Hanusia_phi.AAC.1
MFVVSGCASSPLVSIAVTSTGCSDESKSYIVYIITQPVCSERPAGAGPVPDRVNSDWQAVASRRQSRTVRKLFHTS